MHRLSKKISTKKKVLFWCCCGDLHLKPRTVNAGWIVGTLCFFGRRVLTQPSQVFVVGVVVHRQKRRHDSACCNEVVTVDWAGVLNTVLRDAIERWKRHRLCICVFVRSNVDVSLVDVGSKRAGGLDDLNGGKLRSESFKVLGWHFQIIRDAWEIPKDAAYMAANEQRFLTVRHAAHVDFKICFYFCRCRSFAANRLLLGINVVKWRVVLEF